MFFSPTRVRFSLFKAAVRTKIPLVWTVRVDVSSIVAHGVTFRARKVSYILLVMQLTYLRRHTNYGEFGCVSAALLSRCMGRPVQYSLEQWLDALQHVSSRQCCWEELHTSSHCWESADRHKEAVKGAGVVASNIHSLSHLSTSEHRQVDRGTRHG